VELMETPLKLYVQIGTRIPLQIASIIGSGINGNTSREVSQNLGTNSIASIIGSGINGNFTSLIESDV